MNKKTMEIEKGLPAKVYLLAYEKPKSGYLIANEIYGHDHHGVRNVINKLSPEGYFIPIPIEDKKDPYWLSNVEILLDKIRKETFLVKHEEVVLKKILSSKAFKFLLNKQMPENLLDTQINAVDYILTLLDVLIIMSKEIEVFRERGKKIDLEFNYDFAVNKIQKDKKLMKKMQDITKRLFKESDLPSDVINDLPYLFVIPDNLKAPVQGLSEFGKKYYEVKPFFEEISKLLKT